MASFGIIFSGGPTPVTQGARRAPVPKGVRHRDCYTPTLVWAVTIEMHRTPPHEVGGWGRPQSGRLVEKRRGRFSSCQDGKWRRFPEEDDSSWYTACTVSPPPGTPSQYFVYFICSFENNETKRVGAQVEIGPYGKGPGRFIRRRPHLGQQDSETSAKIV